MFIYLFFLIYAVSGVHALSGGLALRVGQLSHPIFLFISTPLPFLQLYAHLPLHHRPFASHQSPKVAADLLLKIGCSDALCYLNNLPALQIHCFVLNVVAAAVHVVGVRKPILDSRNTVKNISSPRR